MKNVLILIVLFSMISLSAQCQKSAPENVKKEFSIKYAKVQSVKWSSEEANEWEAEFKMNGKKMSACFDNEGKWIESETAISEKDLPVEVVNTLNKDFKGFKRGPVEIFESTEMKGFELRLTKGEEAIEVIFDNTGSVLKKTVLEEDDDEED